MQTRIGMEDERNERTDRKGMILTEWGTDRGEEKHKGWGYERVMTGDRLKRKEGGGERKGSEKDQERLTEDKK